MFFIWCKSKLCYKPVWEPSYLQTMYKIFYKLVSIENIQNIKRRKIQKKNVIIDVDDSTFLSPFSGLRRTGQGCCKGRRRITGCHQNSSCQWFPKQVSTFLSSLHVLSSVESWGFPLQAPYFNITILKTLIYIDNVFL